MLTLGPDPFLLLFIILFYSSFHSRLSGSKRNVERIRTDAKLVQERFAQESSMLYEQQHANMEKRLQKRKDQRERAHSQDYSPDEDHDNDIDNQEDENRIRQSHSSSDPFRGMEEAIAEERRLGNLQPVLNQLELRSSGTESSGEEEVAE